MPARYATPSPAWTARASSASESRVPGRGRRDQGGGPLPHLGRGEQLAAGELKLPAKQLDALRVLADSPRPLTPPELALAARCQLGPIGQLRKKKLVSAEVRRIQKTEVDELPTPREQNLHLNSDQQAALEAAVKYASDRQAFGHSIGSYQAIQFMIADMEVRASTARLAYYRAAEKMLRGEPFKREASIAKLYSSEIAMDNARYATQVHGGYGFMNEFPVGRFYRNAKGAVIYEGTRDIHTLMQADWALGLKKEKPARKTLPTWKKSV